MPNTYIDRQSDSNTTLIESSTPIKPYYVALDGLRGIAAVGIILFHYTDELYMYIVPNPIVHGYLAVDFFFCLSGFVIGYAYDDRMKTIGLGRFFINRLIRLHPLVVIGSIIGLIAYLFDPFIDNSFAVGWKLILPAFFLSLFMIPAPSPQLRGGNLFPCNTPAWSLFFEYIINIVYALVLCRVSRRVLVFIGVLSAAFLIYTVKDTGWFPGGWGRTNYMHGLARVSYSFIAGLLIFRYQMVWQHRLGFLLPCLLLIGVFLSPHYRGDWVNELNYVMLVLPLIVCLGAGTRVKGLSERICKLLGRISYPLYMTHIATVFMLGNYCLKFQPSSGKISLSLIIITSSLIVFNLLFAYVLMRWIDEPLRKKLNQLTRKK